MRLKVGQGAPLFAINDLYGRQISLASYAGRKVMVSFHRAAACPLCNVRMSQLITRYPMYQQRGLEIIAFFESSPENAHHYLDRFQSPFPIIADIGRTVYSLYGLRSSALGQVRGLMRRSVIREASQKDIGEWRLLYNLLRVDGRKLRLPADFLLGGPDLRIRRAYYAHDSGDFLPFSELDRFLSSDEDAPARRR